MEPDSDSGMSLRTREKGEERMLWSSVSSVWAFFISPRSKRNWRAIQVHRQFFFGFHWHVGYLMWTIKCSLRDWFVLGCVAWSWLRGQILAVCNLWEHGMFILPWNGGNACQWLLDILPKAPDQKCCSVSQMAWVSLISRLWDTNLPRSIAEERLLLLCLCYIWSIGDNAASCFGCTKREAWARASLMSEKVATALPFHVMAFLLSLEVDSSSLSGCRMSAHPGTNRWLLSWGIHEVYVVLWIVENCK